MTVYGVAFVIFTIVTTSTQTPFILDQSFIFCNYFSKESNSHIEATSEILTVKFDHLQINFKLCGKFNKSESCPVGVMACLVNHKTGEKLILGTDFQYDGPNQLLKTINGSKCTMNKSYSLVVNLRRYKLKPSYFPTKEDCTYNVQMMDPSFTPWCSLKVQGYILDLSPLARRFTSQNTARNFSVTLCGENRDCGPDNNACEFTKETVVPISQQSSLYATYSGEKNQLSFHGFTQLTSSTKIDKKFEVVLKCNWDKNVIWENDLKYIENWPQGRKYTFELETSYGCIKKPMPCTVHDGFWIYDLSKLYDPKAIWHTRGTPYRNASVYFLQICGTGKNPKCQSSYAQVCEHVNRDDINRGSVLSDLSVTNDGLTAKIDGGTKCDENKRHTTLINFKCDKEEHGPQLMKQDKCNTHFYWKTPEACPIQNASSCTYITAEPNNCTFYTNNNYYDLTSLNKTKIIGEKKDKDLQFFLNICEPVGEEETPCVKDMSVVRKNLSEPNIKHRIASLGKFSGRTVRSGSLVIEYRTGTYCDDGKDYTSEIRLECSQNEEDPIISAHNKCYYEFLWKTKHACPRPMNKNSVEALSDTTSCSFIDHAAGKSIDFGHLVPIQFDGANMSTSIFYICSGLYLNCTAGQNECISIPFENQTVTISRGSTTLEVHLSRTCTSPNEYNTLVLNFSCNRVKNNDHLQSVIHKGCEIIVDYLTDVVCSSQYSQEVSEHDVELKKPEVSFPQKSLPEEVSKHDAELKKPEAPLLQKNLLKEVVSCSIKSPFTGHELNIQNFTNDFFKKNCPAATFNDTFQFVKLHYTSVDRCRPVPTKNISYEVYLICKRDEKLTFLNQDCLQLYDYQRPEYCSFFASSGYSKTLSIIAGISGSIIIIVLLAIGIVIWKRRSVYVKRDARFMSILYEKDTQI